MNLIRSLQFGYYGLTIKAMLNTLNLRKFLLFIGDVFVLYLSLLITVFSGFFRLKRAFGWDVFMEHLMPFSLVYLSWLVIFYIFGFYDIKIAREGPAFYTKIFGAVLTGLALGMIFFYLSPISEITPKTNLVISALIFMILFLGWRKLFFAIFSTKLITRVAIIGPEQQAREIIKEIESRPYLGYQIVPLNLLGDLLVQTSEKKIDTLIIPTDLASDSQLAQNLYRCLSAKVNFLDWATAYELICEKIPNEFLAHTWFLENLKEGEKKLYDSLKKIMDAAIALALLVATIPFWPIIALFIKLGDKGPVFYRQKRIGKDGKPFTLFKFRSMRQEAEAITGAVWAKEKDPRVTRTGRFLRRLHIDELPQMLNIMKGEISLVGPRPERPEFISQLEKEIPHYRMRHLIKPGFTGWAQLKFRYGRSVMDAKEKFQYDLYYLKNRSLILDAGILLKTFRLFFKKEQG